jgi:hypothetical protein
MSRGLPGAVGIAYAPVGNATRVTSLGELSAGVAWSTMKVPVAIAAVDAADGSPSVQTRKLMVAAITRSDNAAAEALWEGLGTPAVAARRTQAILRASGDGSTVVQSQRVRAGFTAFGQTHWTLQRQAGFAATLPCGPGSASVLALMRQITTEQRWGLGSLATNPAFKGGWGPDVDGAYVVRQMGVLSLSDGTRIGVALAAKPADGSFSTGTRYLGELAKWLANNVRSGGGRC